MPTTAVIFNKQDKSPRQINRGMGRDSGVEKKVIRKKETLLYTGNLQQIINTVVESQYQSQHNGIFTVVKTAEGLKERSSL